MSHNDDNETSFGFSRVTPDEKRRRVGAVFSSVAENYDLMNDLMSGGVHRIWKSVLLDRMNPRPGEALLDMAGGTGDVAHGFLKRADDRNTGALPPATAVICDINHSMLTAGIERDAEKGFGARLSRVCGDAENIPLPDKSVDAYVISFGIRNVSHMDKAIEEAFRVLKIGGRFFCLEFSHPVTDGLQKIYDAYSFNIIPWLGEKVAKDRKSYQYLVESIRKFPLQDHFAAMIKEGGFSRVKYENLSGGVAAIHSGWRV